MLNIKKLLARMLTTQTQTLAPESGWTLYGSAPIEAKRVLNTVHINGAVKLTANTTLNSTQKKVCSLPASLRPAYPVYAVCQGSGTSIFLVRVDSDGVSIGRLRDMASANGSFSTGDTGMWFPISISYTI